MNTVAINRNELSNLFDAMTMPDIVWAIRHLSERLTTVLPEQAERNEPMPVDKNDLKVATWTDMGVDEKTARQCVRSMKDYKAGRYTACRSKRELNAFFENL